MGILSASCLHPITKDKNTHFLLSRVKGTQHICDIYKDEIHEVDLQYHIGYSPTTKRKVNTL